MFSTFVTENTQPNHTSVGAIIFEILNTQISSLKIERKTSECQKDERQQQTHNRIKYMLLAQFPETPRHQEVAGLKYKGRKI